WLLVVFAGPIPTVFPYATRFRVLFRSLTEHGYTFREEPTLLLTLLKGEINLQDYLQVDDTVIYYYFQRWQFEKDEILRDLCTRFINRHLFKYTEFDPINDAEKLTQLKALFQQAGLDPNYYLVVDSSADLPYDVYRLA